jgi:hypothetical protein
VPTRIPDSKVIHTYRLLRIIMANDGVVAPSSATLFARLLQFGDSAFPVGGFSFSGGLESAIQKAVVTDIATLHAFTRTAVEQAERGDAIRLIDAHRPATAGDVDALIPIDERVHVRKLSTEMRTMSVRMGKKFTEMSVQVIGAPPALHVAGLHRNVRYSGMLSGGAGGKFRPCKACRRSRRSPCAWCGGDDAERRVAVNENQPCRDAKDPL